MVNRVLVISMMLASATVWAQAGSTGAEPAATGPSSGGTDEAMVTPAPVSGEGYSMGFTNETRSNYVRGGLTFSSAYDDNVFQGTSGKPLSDVSYSISPSISLDQTRSRLHWTFSYAPGFTFYQKYDSRNAADQNFAIDLKYRLSPHVTLTARDSFLKTSNTLNQPNGDFTQPVSGGVSQPNNSIVAPVSDVLTNNASVGVEYQFSLNGMVGASGSFTNLHYPTQAQVPGLSDSSSRAGSVFYNHRLSKMHYIGASYEYQMFLAYPTQGQSETQAHSISLFYTLYLRPTLSFSFFGGPQYSDTEQFGVPASKAWTPSGGASMGWQGRLTSFAASYSQRISDGGGLSGAVKANSANASLRRQLTRSLNASLGASYDRNSDITALALLNSTGHSISGNASAQRQIGQHFNLQVQYSRIHQSYSGIQAISGNPDRNRVSATIAYSFSRPLGR